MRKPTLSGKQGKAGVAGEASDGCNRSFRRGSDGGTRVQGDRRNTGSPRQRAGVSAQPVVREDRTGLLADGGRARKTCEAE
jgi:hypothetical protein